MEKSIWNQIITFITRKLIVKISLRFYHSEISRRIRVVEHALQVDFLLAVGARLFLPHNAPAADTKLVESDRVCQGQTKVENSV